MCGRQGAQEGAHTHPSISSALLSASLHCTSMPHASHPCPGLKQSLIVSLSLIPEDALVPHSYTHLTPICHPSDTLKRPTHTIQDPSPSDSHCVSFLHHPTFNSIHDHSHIPLSLSSSSPSHRLPLQPLPITHLTPTHCLTSPATHLPTPSTTSYMLRWG